jgi:cell division transport system ATP-binding protein
MRSMDLQKKPSELKYLKGNQKEKAEFMLREFGLSERLYYLPHELSIGEQQRVAIARTLACSPDPILADEPAGNIDPETGFNINRATSTACKILLRNLSISHSWKFSD